jgi:hypothetical protein
VTAYTTFSSFPTPTTSPATTVSPFPSLANGASPYASSTPPARILPVYVNVSIYLWQIPASVIHLGNVGAILRQGMAIATGCSRVYIWRLFDAATMSYSFFDQTDYFNNVNIVIPAQSQLQLPSQSPIATTSPIPPSPSGSGGGGMGMGGMGMGGMRRRLHMMPGRHWERTTVDFVFIITPEDAQTRFAADPTNVVDISTKQSLVAASIVSSLIYLAGNVSAFNQTFASLAPEVVSVTNGELNTSNVQPVFLNSTVQVLAPVIPPTPSPSSTPSYIPPSSSASGTPSTTPTTSATSTSVSSLPELVVSVPFTLVGISFQMLLAQPDALIEFRRDLSSVTGVPKTLIYSVQDSASNELVYFGKSDLVNANPITSTSNTNNSSNATPSAHATGSNTPIPIVSSSSPSPPPTIAVTPTKTASEAGGGMGMMGMRVLSGSTNTGVIILINSYIPPVLISNFPTNSTNLTSFIQATQTSNANIVLSQINSVSSQLNTIFLPAFTLLAATTNTVVTSYTLTVNTSQAVISPSSTFKTTTTPTNADANSSSLTGNAIAGIVVGAAFVALVAAFLAIKCKCLYS